MTKYHATILTVKLLDIIEKSVRTFEQNFGTIRSYPVRRELLKLIKTDLLNIMTDAVNISLDYFYAGKDRGDMAAALKRGIQVKGQSLLTVSAILHGLDYTLIHEENTKLLPKGKSMLAIPLPDACYSDGRPKMSSPDRWNVTEKTFVIPGTTALNTYNRKPATTGINPHSPSQVAYIVYKNKQDGNLVYLYKLVPYSLFYEGYTNYKGVALKKLGLRGRIEAGIRSAIPGWYNLVWNLLESVPDFTNLRAYEDIKVDEIIEKYSSSYTKGSIPKGRVTGNLVDNIENVVTMTYNAITV